MKFFKNLPIAVLGAVILCTFSCGKSGSDNSNSSSNTNTTSNTTLLTATSWKFSKIEYQDKNGAWVNISPLGADAIATGVSFNASGTFADVNTNGWNPHTGTWKFSSDGSTITITQSIAYALPNIIQTATINTLNSSTLQLVTSGTFTGYSSTGANIGTFYAERDTFGH